MFTISYKFAYLVPGNVLVSGRDAVSHFITPESGPLPALELNEQTMN